MHEVPISTDGRDRVCDESKSATRNVKVRSLREDIITVEEGPRRASDVALRCIVQGLGVHIAICAVDNIIAGGIEAGGKENCSACLVNQLSRLVASS